MKITSFEIRNFRAFRNIRLDGLQSVNLVAGQNNVGKTALLEALWQFSGSDQPDVGLRLDQFRGIQWIDEDHLFFDLFHGHNPSGPIELRGTWEQNPNPHVLLIETRIRETSRTPVGGNGSDGGAIPPITDNPREIVLTYDDGSQKYESRGWFATRITAPGVVQKDFETRRQRVPGRPTGVYFSPSHRNAPQEEADKLGRIQVRGVEGMIVDALRLFEPHLQRLVTVSINGLPVIHADLGLDRLMPMGLLGDGIQRVLSMTLAFDTASGGMVLVDEIENGIHHSKLKDLWRAILSFSERFDVQVFATTHSAECVRAAHDAFKEADSYDFRFIRLDRVNGTTKAKSFDRTTLGTAIEADFEIR